MFAADAVDHDPRPTRGPDAVQGGGWASRHQREGPDVVGWSASTYAYNGPASTTSAAIARPQPQGLLDRLEDVSAAAASGPGGTEVRPQG